MPPFAWFELVKILLPNGIAAGLGWLLLRRLEQVKSEVARRSDYSSRWADLSFDASHAYMVALERWMTLIHFICDAAEPNGEQGMKWQVQANALLLELVENYYRIERLAVLAPSKATAAKAAATKILESTEKGPRLVLCLWVISAVRLIHSTKRSGRRTLKCSPLAIRRSRLETGLSAHCTLSHHFGA